MQENDDSFIIEIAKDLLAQGYRGDELVDKVEEQYLNIQKAYLKLINEADEIACGKRDGATTKDIFGED